MGSGGNFGEDLLNVGTNLLTGGLAGYDGEGNGFAVGKGLWGNPIEEGVKEVTGANAAEEANELAREQYEEARAEAKKQRENEQSANAARQLQASKQGSTTRSSSSNTTSSRAASSLINDETDFLGL